MSHPRRSLPGQSQALSRRCARRCFFLRPGDETNQCVLYCLGLALDRHPSVRLTCFYFAGNHYHFLASDDEGRLSDFMGYFNGLLARAMNCILGRGENFWAPGSFSNVETHDEESLWDQLVYATGNCVKDGLVERVEDWPGLVSKPEDVGTTIFRAERPSKFFRSKGSNLMPEVVEFQLEPPVELEDADLEIFQATYRAHLDAMVAEVHAEFAAEGRTWMGATEILRQDPLASAGDTFPDRDTNPRVACKDGAHRCVVLQGLTCWRFAHWVAWQLWSHGQRDVVFPEGTFWMRVKYGVRCRDPSPGRRYALAA